MAITDPKGLPKMEYVRFGNTGLRDEEESLEVIGKEAYAGINFFDTADAYSNGESERVLGKAIQMFNMPRSRIVVATKVFYTIAGVVEIDVLGRQLDGESEYVNSFGFSRKHIFDACSASLERSGLDYIDLYQIHRFDHVSIS
ncbi:uncharacterized protein ATC70_005792 [Mucor velutinosus]|uniref:NADP-dependent oxidoreductase domain-containing protein n=1 Tax=Mucor velutinosus TaxID=708070 RepID=A0AAN7HZ75_9FUNG|nr:hypothetical protein ATC70_005792 [Mucor velutinosus]